MFGSRFRMLRDRVMSYGDDFIRANTLARVENIARHMQPRIDRASGIDVHIYRAIAHYMGQCSVRKSSSLWLLEAAAAGLCAMLPLLLLRGIFQRRSRIFKGCRAYYALLAPVSDQVAALYKIPQELSDNATPKVFVARLWRLSPADLRILARLAVLLAASRCPFPIQFFWKCAKDMALMRGYLDAYPDADYALIAGEYSCSIGIAALQYSLAGKALYNVMHGDNASTPMESFFKIDRFYAWDAHYIDLFREQRIDADFRISPNPDFVRADDEPMAETGVGVVIPMMNFAPDRYTDFDALLADFARALDAIPEHIPVTLRPHPAYMHTYSQLAGMIRRPAAMSDPRTETAHAFLVRHRWAFGFYSTVLVEGAHLGVHVMVARNGGSAARAGYHGLFRRDNVRHADLASLPEALAAFISESEDKNRDKQHVA